MKKILFNGLGNRGWIGGIYYIKNIIFSCLQNKEITSKYELVLFIDEKHADIFEPFKGQITIRVFGNEGKLKLAWAQAKQVWFGGVKYCYALELNKTGKLFKNRGIFWIPDFQHKNLPEFFSEEELERKDANFLEMVMSDRPMVLSSYDAKNDLERFYPEHKCPVEVVHFVSYIEPEIKKITPKLEHSVAEKFGLHRNYIYIPNQFWQHKNHIVMVKAIQLLLESGRLTDYDFVFTGNLEDYRNPEYISRLKGIMESETVKHNIKLLGFVGREEQLCIMKNAAFIVQPSLCEGWGTVLEDAKVLDKRVLLSDIPVHREQKNEKCILFDPHQPEKLADLIAGLAAENKEEGQEDVSVGIANMYREALEYSKGLERVFR